MFSRSGLDFFPAMQYNEPSKDQKKNPTAYTQQNRIARLREDRLYGRREND